MWLLKLLLEYNQLPADGDFEAYNAVIRQSAAHLVPCAQNPICDSYSSADVPRLTKLHRLVLLLKIAMLLSSVEYEDVKARTAERAVWGTLMVLSSELPSESAASSSAEIELEKHASVTLVEMLLPLMRQTVGARADDRFRNGSFGVLEFLHHLLQQPPSVSQATANAMVQQGRRWHGV